MADQTYAKLVDALAERHFSGVTPDLRNNILSFYAEPNAAVATQKDQKEWQKLTAELQELKAAPIQATSGPEAGSP